MKNKIHFVLLCAMLCILVQNLFAQNPIAKTKVYTATRYINKGIELRWLPENNSMLRLALQSNATIERAEGNSNKYSTIATVKPFTKEEWNTLIANTKDTTLQGNMSMAMEFMFADPKEYAKPISIDKGIGELNDQYSKEQMMAVVILKSALLHQKIAQALGLGFFDNSTVAGKTYTYRIKINAKSNIYAIEDGIATIKATINTDVFNTPIIVNTGDEYLSFIWEKPNGLNGYLIERATSENGKYEPMNIDPFYISYITDEPKNGAFRNDSLQNYTWYYYKFYALNNFGEKVLFAKSKGMPKDLTPPRAPFLPQPKHVKTNQILINWEKKTIESDLAGYFVGRCNSDTGQFKIIHNKILPPNTKSYIDTGFDKNGSNFYTVFAIDTSGNISASLSNYVVLIDSTPPAIPLIVKAIIDSYGVVTINVKNNVIDKDIKGHKLYRANGKDHEYSFVRDFFNEDEEMGKPVKYIFIDTISLHSITPNIYYKLKAIDYHYNMSAFSEPLIVKRPDTIPPTTPVFTNVEVSDNEIKLYFEPSGSIDVIQHILYKKASTDSVWKEIEVPNPSLKQYNDKDVKSGIIYTYTLRAKDNSNLFSKYSVSVDGKPYINSLIPGVEQLLVAKIDSNIVLNWRHNLPKDERKFIIYKQNKLGQMVQYSSTDDLYFKDNFVEIENIYAVKVFSVKGAQSKLSNKVSIIIKK